jgi:hypothetical protein
MPQEYIDYIEAYISNYCKKVPELFTPASALGTRRAAQGEPPEPCWSVVAQVALLNAQTEPSP